MEASAVVFMLGTMGFVVALVGLCIRAWVRAKPKAMGAPAGPADANPSDADESS